MKSVIKILIIPVITFALSSFIFAGDKTTEKKVSESTVASLLEGLSSDNLGLKSSSAFMLGELEVTSAIIPLLRVLHNDKNEEIRISAALALYKIGTPLSIYAVKQAGRFDESKRVSTLAQKFYYDYLRQKQDGENALNTDTLIAQHK